MSRDLQVQGLTHTTLNMYTALGATLFQNAANVIKSEISLVSGSSIGTLWISGGSTFPVSLTVGAGMVQASNVAGIAYTVYGPAPFYLGVVGITTTVQILQSLSNIGGMTYR